jgi:uncharacterized NAD-dependent epimerase/dehydratase family protein
MNLGFAMHSWAGYPNRRGAVGGSKGGAAGAGVNRDGLAILVNSEDPFNAKTAVGVLRYGRDPIVALVDPERAGRTAADVYGVRSDVPIMARVADLPPETGRLLVGIASRGGQLPEEMRSEILEAINRGMDVLNGLHTFLNADPMLVEAARGKGAGRARAAPPRG